MGFRLAAVCLCFRLCLWLGAVSSRLYAGDGLVLPAVCHHLGGFFGGDMGFVHQADARAAAARTLVVAVVRFLLALAPLLLPVLAHAQAITPQQVHWSVNPAFGKEASARQNISGAACAPTQPPLTSCLAVNDQKKYA